MPIVNRLVIGKNSSEDYHGSAQFPGFRRATSGLLATALP